jgi:hypothetical protein
LEAGLTKVLCEKKIIVAKSKEVKTRQKLLRKAVAQKKDSFGNEGDYERFTQKVV